MEKSAQVGGSFIISVMVNETMKALLLYVNLVVKVVFFLFIRTPCIHRPTLFCC